MIASRMVFGGEPYTLGSLISKVHTRPGSMKAAVIQKTGCHGMRSARISDSAPGTMPATLYALTMTAAPRPCSLSLRISRR